MIHIFFGFGMFGHMINYAINRFGFKDTRFKKIGPRYDGSMHHNEILPPLFMHYRHIKDWQNVKIIKSHTSTPGYLLEDAKFEDVCFAVSNQIDTWPNDKKILITSYDLESAALNLLFQYHKIAHGVRNLGMGIFYGGVTGEPYKQWNNNYTGFESMERWEFREWFSIAWKGIVLDYIVDFSMLHDWLVIDNRKFINDIGENMQKIMEYCNFEYTPDLDQFLQDYWRAQQYIIDEFDLIHEICSGVVSNKNLEWDSISVISEALIQSNLRDLGYEIKCQGLNDFPTTTIQLNQFLDSLTLK